jgi:hypothetical protein
MVELKASESEVDFDSESNLEGGNRIIDVEPQCHCHYHQNMVK